MIQKETVVQVIDNTGAKLARCIGLYSCGSVASTGDLIRVTLISVKPNSKVKKGEVHKARVVRTVADQVLPNGGRISFDSNAVVLVNEKLEPIGTRITGVVTRKVPANLRAIAGGLI